MYADVCMCMHDCVYNTIYIYIYIYIYIHTHIHTGINIRMIYLAHTEGNVLHPHTHAPVHVHASMLACVLCVCVRALYKHMYIQHVLLKSSIISFMPECMYA
jgi:hypothetical protein